MAEPLSGSGESMRTMNWKTVRGTLLVVHTKSQPDDAEWATFVKDVAAMGSTMKRALVFADVPLNAEQRRQVAELHKAANTRAIAIITSSALTRMVVTALSWTHRTHKAFAPTEVGEAFDFLELNDADRQELVAITLQFARELNHTHLAQTLVRS